MINNLQEWKSGSGQKTSFQKILQIMKQHSKKNGTVYGQKGGRYFFAKRKEPKKAFSNLAIRMLKEAEETIEIARAISEENPKIKLELHLDISSSDKQEKTSHLAKMLIGYVNGSGYDCRIKPHAFAANSIADRHSK